MSAQPKPSSQMAHEVVGRWGRLVQAVHARGGRAAGVGRVGALVGEN